MTSKTTPLITLNLKAYPQSIGERGLRLCQIARDVAESSGVRIVVCPDATLLREAVRLGAEVFAQDVSPYAAGAKTGWIVVEQLADAGVKGSLINHSEHRMEKTDIEKAVGQLRRHQLQSMVCSQDDVESGRLACLNPTFVAVEPPELIGSGISVSTAKPEIVQKAVEAIALGSPDTIPICGAGVSTPSDVKRAFELGVRGVLLASAFVKAEDPKRLLEEMAAQVF